MYAKIMPLSTWTGYAETFTFSLKRPSGWTVSSKGCSMHWPVSSIIQPWYMQRRPCSSGMP